MQGCVVALVGARRHSPASSSSSLLSSYRNIRLIHQIPIVCFSFAVVSLSAIGLMLEKSFCFNLRLDVYANV